MTKTSTTTEPKGVLSSDWSTLEQSPPMAFQRFIQTLGHPHYPADRLNLWFQYRQALALEQIAARLADLAPAELTTERRAHLRTAAGLLEAEERAGTLTEGKRHE